MAIGENIGFHPQFVSDATFYGIEAVIDLWCNCLNNDSLRSASFLVDVAIDSRHSKKIVLAPDASNWGKFLASASQTDGMMCKAFQGGEAEQGFCIGVTLKEKLSRELLWRV